MAVFEKWILTGFRNYKVTQKEPVYCYLSFVFQIPAGQFFRRLANPLVELSKSQQKMVRVFDPSSGKNDTKAVKQEGKKEEIQIFQGIARFTREIIPKISRVVRNISQVVEKISRVIEFISRANGENGKHIPENKRYPL